jgi:hypothetical protein
MPAFRHPAGAIAPAAGEHCLCLFLEVMMQHPNSSQNQAIAAIPGIHCGHAIPDGGQSTLPLTIDHVSEDVDTLDWLDDDRAIEWSEEDVVFLHWRLLQEVGDLRDPETPLEEKLDTLRWIFTEREKESRPFSFVNCLKVVGCSPLSPTAYFGLVDADEIRTTIRFRAKAWLHATLERYPCWVRDAVLTNPAWVESRLAKNPQWINEQIKKYAAEGDLFA